MCNYVNSTTMKKLLLSSLFSLSVMSLFAMPDGADTLNYRCDYYFNRRDTHEAEIVTRRNIVMLGNSITERGSWNELLDDDRVLNRGIGGDCISGMIARINPIVMGHPRKIFIMAGVNDLVFSRITVDHLLAQYERLLDLIRKVSPRTKIYVQSLLPLNEGMNEQYFKDKNVRIKEFNAALCRMAERRGLTYIDIHSRMSHDGVLPAGYTVDGIHLSADGYAVWCDMLRPYIR